MVECGRKRRRARLDIGGKRYEFRMIFRHGEPDLFDENELTDICILNKGSSADSTEQQLRIMRSSPIEFFDLQVKEIVFEDSP